jgi:hypothetical protein
VPDQLRPCGGPMEHGRQYSLASPRLARRGFRHRGHSVTVNRPVNGIPFGAVWYGMLQWHVQTHTVSGAVYNARSCCGNVINRLCAQQHTH